LGLELPWGGAFSTVAMFTALPAVVVKVGVLGKRIGLGLGLGIGLGLGLGVRIRVQG
jgi:hypothetical protein